MEWGLLFLLLPVAALSGWLIGRKGGGREQRLGGAFNTNYFKGLNYLLNEQSDKAIEVFVHMLEVDSETVETHFALGNLFLRRGETDRAIRIHQNLIARPTLTPLQRQQALFELGKDYLRAGLLDRAETLFIQSAGNAELASHALRHLLEVYQLEKEWHKAIEVALRLKDKANLNEVGPMIAHFFCEEAEEALRNNHFPEARRLVKRALDEDQNCVRATLIEAQMDRSRRDYKGAIRCLQRVEYQDAGFLPEALILLRECHQHLGSDDELLVYLDSLVSRHKGGSSAVLLYAEEIGRRNGHDEAILFLMHYLNEHPSLRVLKKALEWKLNNLSFDGVSDLEQIDKIIGLRIEGRPGYQCRNCGFTSRTLHWQCPTCKRWNTVKSLQALEGE